MDCDPKGEIPHKIPFLAIQIWLDAKRRENGWNLLFLLVRLAKVFEFGKMVIAIQNMVLLNVTYVQNVVESFPENCLPHETFYLFFFVKR